MTPLPAMAVLMSLNKLTVALGGAEPLVNTDDGLALHGYDAVFYQQPGGPQLGDTGIATVVAGGTYRFASKEIRATFTADPARYLPAYGGWCAYAMASADYVDVDPKTFKIIDGRLYLFYNGWLGNSLTTWNKAWTACQSRCRPGEAGEGTGRNVKKLPAGAEART